MIKVHPNLSFPLLEITSWNQIIGLNTSTVFIVLYKFPSFHAIKKSLETVTAPLQENTQNLKYFCLTAA